MCLPLPLRSFRLDQELLFYALLLLTGLIAGVINTLAGGGSNLTIPALLLMGLPADMANATNRVGVLLQCGVLSLAMLLALALGADAADPRHDQAMEGIQSLRRWGVPLTALLIMSVLIRGLPPAPLLWVQQTHPAWAVARYLYWRYAVRLALLCILLRESGWGPILWRFWQTSTHE